MGQHDIHWLRRPSLTMVPCFRTRIPLPAHTTILWWCLLSCVHVQVSVSAYVVHRDIHFLWASYVIVASFLSTNFHMYTDMIILWMCFLSCAHAWISMRAHMDQRDYHSWLKLNLISTSYFFVTYHVFTEIRIQSQWFFMISCYTHSVARIGLRNHHRLHRFLFTVDSFLFQICNVLTVTWTLRRCSFTCFSLSFCGTTIWNALDICWSIITLDSTFWIVVRLSMNSNLALSFPTVLH